MTSTIPGLLPAGAPPLDDEPVVPAGLRVLGLDLSITSTGVCRPDGTTFRIKTRQKDGPRRMNVIRDALAVEVAEQRPHLAVIEDLPMNAGRMSLTNLKNMAGLHGVVLSVLVDAGVLWAYVNVKHLKSFACDNGGADKADMAAAAYLAAGVRFSGDPGGDQCDAWWLRAAALDHYGHPLFDLPQAQRDRLLKVGWPVLAEVTA